MKAGLTSLWVGLFAVAFSLLLGAPTAYALARFKIPGVAILLFFLLSVRLFPDISAVIPVAELLLSRPFIPRDLEEQAFVLGAAKSKTFFKILTPLALPGLGAAAIYTFFLSWNEFIFAYFLTFQGTETTLPVYLLRILSWSPQKNFISAISLLICVPVIIFTFLVQRYMREGLTAGAVK